jgi:signal transduction histidine kinase
MRRVLREASGALSSVLDLDRVKDTIIAAVSEVIRSEGVALYLVSGYGMHLTTSKIAQPSRFATPFEPPLTLLQTVSAEPETTIVADDIERLASQEAGCQELDITLRANDWALIVPLMSQGVLVGILVLGRKLSGDPFSQEDLDAVSTFANHASSAVKNAQLYAESALAKDYIGNIVTTIPSGVIAVSIDGRVVLFNAAAEQLTGISQSQTSGASIDVLPAPLCDALRTALASPQRRTYPHIDMSSTDFARRVICTTAPLRDHGGNLAGAVAVLSDLSPVRELERERARAERLAGFQVLTQALAHEIANPLSPIKTMTRLLEQRGDDRAFINEFQRIVTRELERMEQLIARLRAVGRPQRQILGKVNLSKTVAAAIEVLAATASERGIMLTSTVKSPDLAIVGDEMEFQEVFLNLIKNAIEAIPEGRMPRSVSVGMTTIESHAVVQVKDTGCGFSPALIDQIFVPFVSTKPHGSGLGLAICASIVQRTGGRIEVANGPEGGGIVTVRLPLQ